MRDEIEEALRHVRMLTEHAYEHGFHELGYDPVAVVADALAAARKDTERLDYLLTWLERHPIIYEGGTLGHRWGGDNHERRQGLDAARKGAA